MLQLCQMPIKRKPKADIFNTHGFIINVLRRETYQLEITAAFHSTGFQH